MKATLTLPGSMADFLEGAGFWDETETDSVALADTIRNGTKRRYGKGYTLTLEVTKRIARHIAEYAETLSYTDEASATERKASRTTLERIKALAFPKPEPVADETAEEVAVRKSVDAQFPIVAEFLADKPTNTVATTQCECCNYCMWFGPVNKDGNMRKHRPATSEDHFGRKVQDMNADYCEGSHKPYARFGCETDDAPKTAEPVKVRFGLSDETRKALREQGAKARDDFRARTDSRRFTPGDGK
jgi:hypothetical protein